MKKIINILNIKTVLISIILIQFIIIIYFVSQKLENKVFKEKNSINSSSIFTDDCSKKEIKYKIINDYMEPFLNMEKEVKVLNNFYKCGGNITRGDIIIYNSNSTKNPILSQIKAIPGDKILVDFNKGNLYINGEILVNSSKQKYIFKNSELIFLNLYIQEGILQNGAFFIFGDNISQAIDSRNLGAVSEKGFIGKIIQ